MVDDSMPLDGAMTMTFRKTSSTASISCVFRREKISLTGEEIEGLEVTVVSATLPGVAVANSQWAKLCRQHGILECIDIRTRFF